MAGGECVCGFQNASAVCIYSLRRCSFADKALDRLDFLVAEQAFVRSRDYQGIDFVKRLKVLGVCRVFLFLIVVSFLSGLLM